MFKNDFSQPNARIISDIKESKTIIVLGKTKNKKVAVF